MPKSPTPILSDGHRITAVNAYLAVSFHCLCNVRSVTYRDWFVRTISDDMPVVNQISFHFASASPEP